MAIDYAALARGYQQFKAELTPEKQATNLAAVKAQTIPNASTSYADTAKAWREKNWYNNGTTATPTTESQNLAAVINQPGNSVAINPTPYIQGVLAQAAKDSAPQPDLKGKDVTEPNLYCLHHIVFKV